jgi:hypothetical protein
MQWIMESSMEGAALSGREGDRSGLGWLRWAGLVCIPGWDCTTHDKSFGCHNPGISTQYQHFAAVLDT